MDNNNKIRKYVPTTETSVFDNSEFTDLSAELAKQKKDQKFFQMELLKKSLQLRKC